MTKQEYYSQPSYIRVNSKGKLVVKAKDSDIAAEYTMEQLFLTNYRLRY